MMEVKNFWSGSFQEAIRRLEYFCNDPMPRRYASLNAHALYWREKSPAFKRALEEADMVSADGASIVLAGRLMGSPVKERVAGCDLSSELLQSAQKKGWGVLCVGMREEVLQKLKERASELWPDLKLETRLVRELEQKPEEKKWNLVLAGLPSPYQEIWIEQNYRQLGGLVMGVGGTLEVLSGQAERAPEMWRKAGLEWFYRFMQQPSRRLQKTWISTVWFAWFLAKDFFSRILKLQP